MIAAGLTLLLTTLSADAHVLVTPSQSPAGGTERYVLTVPSEKPLATVRIEVQFPRQLRVEQIEPVPGWTMTPERDASGRMLAAIWEGGRLESGQIVGLTMLAVNPSAPSELAWSAIQTYEDGSEVQWNGSEQSQFPAATSRVVGSGPDLSAGIVLGAVSLFISLAALVAAVLALAQVRATRRASS